MVYGLVTEKVKDHQSKLQKLVSFRDFTTKYGIRGTYTSKKEESEGKRYRCALYDTSLDKSYQSRVSFFETI